jgi:hypothetical protein
MGTQTLERTSTATGARRGLALVAAAAIAVAVLLPWVTVRGRVPLDLDLLGVEARAGGMTVDGLDTAAWPYMLGVAGLSALIALTGRARALLQGIGVLTMIAGAGLWYYLAHVVEIKTADRSVVEKAVVDLAVGTSVGPGPFVLLGAGAALILATIGARGRR